MSDISVIVCLAFDHRAPADGLQKFKNCIEACPFVERAAEVCGTFDLIVEGHCASLAEYTENVERLRESLATFVTRFETSFVSRSVERTPASKCPSVALWLPCKEGRRRVESCSIDKIVAEGDYMRVHVADWSCLVHETMERLSSQLAGCGFIKLHRSWLVRIGFIDRLVHGERRWEAHLRDGTHVSIAKSHLRAVLNLASGESSTVEDRSAESKRMGENSEAVNQRLMKVSA
jgi:DNA-binding LytR/AlgR family response regulator